MGLRAVAFWPEINARARGALQIRWVLDNLLRLWGLYVNHTLLLQTRCVVGEEPTMVRKLILVGAEAHHDSSIDPCQTRSLKVLLWYECGRCVGRIEASDLLRAASFERAAGQIEGVQREAVLSIVAPPVRSAATA